MPEKNDFKKPKQRIASFEAYIEKHCPGITVEEAKQYGDKGEKLLKHFNEGNTSPPSNESKSDQMAFIHWYLIRKSFEMGRPFSKGMFNLELASPEYTKNLYQYLKEDVTNEFMQGGIITGVNFIKSLFKSASINKEKAYSRDSTHYKKQLLDKVDGHFGIDQHGNIPLAWKFSTHVFGLTENRDGTPSLYIKPEIFSADLNKTWDSIKHGLQLFKSIIGKKEKLEGLEDTYRENQLPKQIKELAKDKLFLNEQNTANKMVIKRIDKCKNMDELESLVYKYNKASAREIMRELSMEIKKMSHNQLGSEIRVMYHSETPSAHSNLSKDSMSSLRDAYTEGVTNQPQNDTNRDSTIAVRGSFEDKEEENNPQSNVSAPIR